MALSGRGAQRFQSNIWPGFVDAMTTLLLILMFVLSVFMIVQYTLQEKIDTQGNELADLSQQLSGLADALGLERARTADLSGRVAGLSGDLAAAKAEADRQSALIVTLTSGMGSIADNSSGGSIVYRSSKAAVNMVMRSLAIDLAPRGIACVVVNPGWVRTEMGGPNATLAPSESIDRLKRLIATFGPEQSGKFFNHTGREYPW